MTDHADLSRRLALALGYYPESVRVVKPWVFEPERNYCEVYRTTNDKGSFWRMFYYSDPSVCLALLKWLAQPYGVVELWPNEESWSIVVHDLSMICGRGKRINADTLEEAVARAVIAVGVK